MRAYAASVARDAGKSRAKQKTAQQAAAVFRALN
jgi:hypothetical protein